MPVRTLSPAALSPATLRRVARQLALEPPGGFYSVGGTDRRPTTRRQRTVADPDELIGTTAGNGWSGVGLVVPTRPADEGVGDDAVVAVVVDRQHQVAVAVRVGRAVESIDGAVGVSGFVADVLQRTLGSPTSPEPTSPTLLIVSVWLQHLLDAVANPDGEPVATWSDALSLHPAWRAGGGVFAVPGSVGPDDPDDVAALTVSLATHLGWERLRSLAASGSISVPGLSPADVSWMDVPFFARWTLGVHRPVTELLDDLSLFLDGPILRDVRYTVDAVGWLGFAGSHASSSTGDG